MKKLLFILIVFVAIGLAAPAFTEIDILAFDPGETGAVRCTWEESGVKWIGVRGDQEFILVVMAAGSSSIESSWLYLDGEINNATTLVFTADDLRVHHGIAIVKYEDETYEQIEFRLNPSWRPQASPAGGALVPVASTASISDAYVSDLIDAVISEDQPGPPQPEQNLICDGESGCCMMVAEVQECEDEWDCL